MRGARYNFQINWACGKSLVIADTLSRAFIKRLEGETDADIPQGIPGIPDVMMEKSKIETQKDSTLQLLIKTIREGWPCNKQNLAQELAPFFELRDTLSVDDDIVLKGERILIPESLRKEIKQKLHAAHLGYGSMMRRVRDTVYWPGIHFEEKTIANTCERCQEAKPRNCRMPLIQRNKGASPWKKIDSSPGRFAKSSTAHVWRNDPDPHPPTGAERDQLPELHVAQPVFYQNPEKPDWKSGPILKKKGTRSYEVQGENGGTYIRNRVHLRGKETPFQADIEDEDESALADAVIDPPLENFTPDPQPNDIPASVVSPPSSDRSKCDRPPPKWMKDFVAQ
ncbi:hypothetical protein RRG08_057588 [Elysia crispata]|uniref:Integrase zinc-binding domain-containing protein n=1 Tax=Elysia crispata TaxID=231223 RepID=A0AAE0ZCB5_9GAST|nr:hypothetical protein RRG08_057588 [Elysia crispata]